MSSLVLELQQEAMDSSNGAADLLRKVLVVASKLGQGELRLWATNELSGYSDSSLDYKQMKEMAPYRCMNAQIMARNPVRGWVPVMFEEAELEGLLSQAWNLQPVSELEHTIKDIKPDAILSIPFPPDVLNKVFSQHAGYRMGIIPQQVVQPSQIRGILDAIRNVVLNWSLKLEEDGILGDGMTFSAKEKNVASRNTYHIQNFNGILGEVNGGNIQVGDFNRLRSTLSEKGVSKKECDELEKILTSLRSPKSDADRTSLLKQGATWVTKNAKNIGVLSDTVRQWFT